MFICQSLIVVKNATFNGSKIVKIDGEQDGDPKMQITKKRLKEIIAEEMNKLNESSGFGRHMAGETDRMAAGYYQRMIFSLATSFNVLLNPKSGVPADQVANDIRKAVEDLRGADPMNYESNIKEAFEMSLRKGFMQESKKSN